MDIRIDSIVYCKHGEFELRMGRAMTGLYYKGVEKFTFRTTEMRDLVPMIQKSLEALKERDAAVKAEFDKLEENPPVLIRAGLDKPA